MPLKPVHWVYAGSFLLHLALGLWLNGVKPPPVKEAVVVEMQTIVKPEKPKEEPKPPEPPPVAPAPKARPTAAPPPPAAAPAPEAAPAAPDFGFAMSSSDGPGGIAVPTEAPKPQAPRQTVRKLEAKPATVEETCADADTKPKALSMPRPAYTDDARSAAIEGKVRVELSLDDKGQVIDAKVLEGLGHGLDEAAIAALKGASFSPGTHCGKPVAAKFTVAVRFAL